MKSLETIFKEADKNSFELGADLDSQQAKSEYDYHINMQADKALVQSVPVEFKLGDGSLPPSRFFADISLTRLECFFRQGSAERLVVFFSGARSRNGGCDVVPYPTFSSWSWYVNTSASVLCIDDPMYFTYPDLTVGWFYGTDTQDYREPTAMLICEIARLLKVNNSDIVLYGRSSGGSAAVAVGSLIPESSVVAINPQLDIEKYKYKGKFVSVTGINPSSGDFKARNDFASMIKSNPKNTFLIISNIASDFDYDVDLKYLTNNFDLKLKYGVSECDNLFLWQYYACGEIDAHGAFENPALFSMILTVLECIKNSADNETVNALASFANSYWADRYELLSRKREINQKAVSRRLEIERLTAELNDKNKQLAEKDKKIAALQKAANSTLLSKIKRAVKKLFKIK